MSIFTKPVFLDSARAAGLAIALGLVLALAPLFSIVALPLLPVPVAFVTSRHGTPLGIIVGLLVGAAAVALTGFSAGLLVFMLAGVAGAGIGICLRLGFSQLRLFGAMTLIFCLVMSVWVASLLVMAGVGPVAAMQQLTDQVVEPTRELYLSLGMSQQGVDDLMLEARDLAAAVPYKAPALFLAFSLALAAISSVAARRAFTRLGQPFPQDYTFRNLRLHFGLAYMMILGLIIELAAPYLPEAFGFPVHAVGANLLIVAEVLFFIQGVAIANHFMWHYKVSRIKRVAVYAGLVLLQLTLSLVSWMGLFDTWIDYRRRFIRKTRQRA